MMRRRLVYLAVSIGTTGLILLGLWAFTEANHSFVVARFSDIWTEFRSTFLFDQWGSDVVPTLRRVAIGFALAVIIGFVAGMALGSSRVLRLLSDPVLSYIRAIPPVALIPPFVILIGIGDSMMIAIVAFVGLWPVALNTADGLIELDATMQDTARSFALSRWERARFLSVPAVLPRTFAGMQTSLAFSLIGVIAAEYLVGTDGLGFTLAQAQQSFVMPLMWAAILMIGIIGFVLNAGFSAIRQRALFWVPARSAPDPT
jgi:ABC-type nitrate/sulfonate/bicarbonate transport system permease component